MKKLNAFKPKKAPMPKLTQAAATRIRTKASKIMGMKDKLPMADPDSAAGAAT